MLALKIKSVYAPVPPKVSQTVPPAKRTHSNVTGDAPWALSALPECFVPQSKTTGRPKYVLAHLPPGLTQARSGDVFHYGDCLVRVQGQSLLVDRGGDHLRVPPPADLYYGKNMIALLRGVPGGYDLRVYVPAAGGVTSL